MTPIVDLRAYSSDRRRVRLLKRVERTRAREARAAAKDRIGVDPRITLEYSAGVIDGYWTVKGPNGLSRTTGFRWTARRAARYMSAELAAANS